MPSSMLQAMTVGPRRVEVGPTDAPGAPGPGEALVAIASVGICGSDIAMWQGTDPYTRYPARQGHEASGRVLRVGPGDRGRVHEGDLVAIEPLLPDGTCGACRRGRPNCCVGLRVIGAHVDGALAERLVLPVANLYPVDDLDPDLVALVEPVSIGLQMVTRGGIGPGDRAVILGAGPIGQAIQLAALDRGARILAVDRMAGRLARARAHGAEVAVDAREGGVAESVDEWTGGDGPEVVFEATGVTDVIRQAIELAAHAGTVVIAGTPTDDVVLPALTIVRKELDVLGSRNSTGLYPAAIDLVRRQRERCAVLITHRFPLAETQDALTFAATHPAEVNKVMIRVAP